MKAVFVSLVAAGLVAAQDFSGQPKCAIPCLEESIPKVGCELEDQACACSSEAQAKLLGIVSGCLIDACSPSELVQAQHAASAACESFAATASGTGGSSATETGTDTDTATTLTLTLTTGSSSTTPTGTPTVTATSVSITTVLSTSGVGNNTTVATTRAPSTTGGNSPSDTDTGDSGGATTTTSPDAGPGGPVAGIMGAIIAGLLAL